jgi:hypothetical protein
MSINSALCFSATFIAIVVCFDVVRFDPKTTAPPITAAIAPITVVGSNLIRKLSQYPNSAGRHRHLRKKHGLPAPLQGLRKFLNFSFKARDLIAQVTIGHTRGVQVQVSLLMKSYLPTP